MDRIYFKNGYEGGTPIPKVIYWYALETNHKSALNADYCNKLLNNELKEFFEKHAEELTNKIRFNWMGENNITKEDVEFYKKEIKIIKEK